MKTKRVLRFYFYADRIERAITNLINRKAMNFKGETLDCAERLCELISEKIALGKFWAYLDSVLTCFPKVELSALERYCSRAGYCSDDDKKLIRRAVIKFIRHAKRLDEFFVGQQLVAKYYCFLGRQEVS